MHLTTINRNQIGKNDEKIKEIDQLSIINDRNFIPYHQNDDMVIVNKDNSHNIVLFEISFQTYALLTLGTPILALIISFLLGFLSDYQQFLNYDWTCGVNDKRFFGMIRKCNEYMKSITDKVNK
ncbi:unnamed protein product [Onchocerca flexuosa]|uniref:Uncharacterized protein n=1 Tax=Onchocerca flexuosa TaxID=387005 RepID=A0A183I7S5_9BILA|nr:unnamed protein product [Onchocerca flexuosa]